MSQDSLSNKLLFHSPRLMAALFALVLIAYAASVFGNADYTMWEKVLSFVVKLVKPALVIGALIIAWKREILGGIIFISLGFAFFLFGWNMIVFWKLLCSGLVMIVIGALFLLNAKEFWKK